jgi:hypothetical protein
MSKKTYNVLKPREYTSNGETKKVFVEVGAAWDIESGGMSIELHEGIPYTVGTVTSDAARALIERHHFRAAPIVEAGQAAWSGFRPDLIDRLNLTEKADICP